MSDPVHGPPKTWEERLAGNTLSEQEWQVLRDMVASGEADSLEEAARMMDFEERDRSFEDSFDAF